MESLNSQINFLKTNYNYFYLETTAASNNQTAMQVLNLKLKSNHTVNINTL